MIVEVTKLMCLVPPIHLILRDQKLLRSWVKQSGSPSCIFHSLVTLPSVHPSVVELIPLPCIIKKVVATV